MKKRIFAMIGCAFIASSMLVGCGKAYPKITVEASEWEGESLKIGVGNKYKYDRYEKSDTDDGCVVSIYFKDVEEE